MSGGEDEGAAGADIGESEESPQVARARADGLRWALRMELGELQGFLDRALNGEMVVVPDGLPAVIRRLRSDMTAALGPQEAGDLVPIFREFAARVAAVELGIGEIHAVQRWTLAYWLRRGALETARLAVAAWRWARAALSDAAMYAAVDGPLVDTPPPAVLVEDDLESVDGGTEADLDRICEELGRAGARATVTSTVADELAPPRPTILFRCADCETFRLVESEDNPPPECFQCGKPMRRSEEGG